MSDKKVSRTVFITMDEYDFVKKKYPNFSAEVRKWIDNQMDEQKDNNENDIKA